MCRIRLDLGYPPFPCALWHKPPSQKRFTSSSMLRFSVQGCRQPPPAPIHPRSRVLDLGETKNGNEENFGSPEIWQSCGPNRRQRHAAQEARNAEIRQGRQGWQGKEPEASHCDRALRGTQKRRQGAEEKSGLTGNLIVRGQKNRAGPSGAGSISYLHF